MQKFAGSMVLVTVLTACSAGDEGRASATTTEAMTTTMTTPAGPGESTTPTTGGVTTGGGASESSTTGGDGGTSTGGSETGGSDDGALPKLDVGVDSEGGCAPEDTCCQEPGFIPPHLLLEQFLAAYPAANMPKDHDALVAFAPVANGHMMTWSDENVGNELIDPDQGGVIEENILEGRAVSRAAAEAVVPAGAMVLEVREDPITIEVLGNGDKDGCDGVGWGWGSIVFQAADKSIGELVFLYIGYCFEGDAEAFYFSEQSVELCPAPG